MNKQSFVKFAVFLASTSSILLLAGCFGSSGSGGSGSGGSNGGEGPTVTTPAPPAREHDTRITDGYYRLVLEDLPFDPIGDPASTDRWWGELDGVGYRIEVPDHWNGALVVYAHGYRGDERELRVDNPEIRPYLIENGYAWAASAYAANHYDVRSGLENSNALALNFTKIAAERGREIEEPVRHYMIGQSMGGHIAGAALEAETLSKANNPLLYDGALSLCGVMADAEILDYFTAYNLAAMQLGGVPADSFPVADGESRVETFKEALWVDYDADIGALTAEGEKLRAILMNLSGGERPTFNEAFSDPISGRRELDILHGYADNDGTAYGILAQNIVDTRSVDYRFETAPGATRTTAENQFNNLILRVSPSSDANPAQDDGLRWIPRLRGELNAPMITLHTLGDLWVPFSMQQIYAQRVKDQGYAGLLVQRAIRAVGHCDFTYEEQVTAFSDLVDWHMENVKPDGDDVLDAATVASPDYGCGFTIDGGDEAFPCP